MKDGWWPISHAVAELANGGLGRDVMLRNLQAGTIKAKARHLHFSTHYRSRRDSPAFPADQRDVEIPRWFWRCCDWSPDYVPTLDWKAGDFGGWAEERGTGVVARALGVTVDIADVRSIVPSAPAAKVSGRPRGSGSFARLDGPLVTRMRQLVESGDAPSTTAAAGMVVGEAQGGGDEQSKIRRLQRAYSKLYG